MWKLLVFVAAVALATGPAGMAATWVQDDPFATGNPAGGSAAAAQPGRAGADSGPTREGAPQLLVLDQQVNPATRAVLGSIRHLDPRGPAELCSAIRTILDLEVEQDARFYLDRLMQLKLDDAGLAALVDSEGSDFFLRLHSSPLLAPEGGEFARSALAASRKAATDPRQLAAMVSLLADPSLEIRSASFQKLRRIGAPAAAALINAFAVETDPDRVLRMRTALRAFGIPGMQPLLAGVTAGPLQVRYECATALARMREADAMHAAAGTAFSPQIADEIRQPVLAGLLETWGVASDSAELRQRVYDRAVELLNGRGSLPLPAGTDLHRTVAGYWVWDSATGSLVEEFLSPALMARRVALDRARELAHRAPDNPRFRQLHLLAWLDAAKRQAGPMTVLDPVAAARELVELTPAELDGAARFASAEGLYPAAAGACDVLGQTPGALDLLYGDRHSGLIRSLQSGDRHLQFCALRAIRNLAPQQGFHGSSQVMEMLVMLAGYAEQPEVFVAHPDPVLGRNLAVTVSTSGLVGQSTTDGRDLYRQATADANVRLLLISDDIAGPDCATLLQQIRTDWRTRLVPAGILTSGDDTGRASRIAGTDPLTIVLPYSTDPALVQSHIQQISGLSREWTVDDSQALDQGLWAVQWLEEIAAERERFGYLDLGPHQHTLVQLLSHQRITAATARILVYVGTADSQRALMEYASQAGLPLELREAAADSFGRSVRRNGLLLTSVEIKRQFDRYNASEGQSADVQRVLGTLLDHIERREPKSADGTQEAGSGNGG